MRESFGVCFFSSLPPLFPRCFCTYPQRHRSWKENTDNIFFLTSQVRIPSMLIFSSFDKRPIWQYKRRNKFNRLRCNMTCKIYFGCHAVRLLCKSIKWFIIDRQRCHPHRNVIRYWFPQLKRSHNKKLNWKNLECVTISIQTIFYSASMKSISIVRPVKIRRIAFLYISIVDSHWRQNEVLMSTDHDTNINSQSQWRIVCISFQISIDSFISICNWSESVIQNCDETWFKIVSLRQCVRNV